MTSEIETFIKSQGFLVCPSCDGEGEIGYFCGHESTTNCYDCGGKGIIKSIEKVKHRKVCLICDGRGGLGCCGNKGYYEWESYELI
jgi:hypothetical protein